MKSEISDSLCDPSVTRRLCAETAVLPLLADPAGYEPNTIDMVVNAAAREYWLDLFERQIPRVIRLAAASQDNTDDAHRRAAAFGGQFGAIVRQVRREPLTFRSLSIILLCTIRENLLNRHGFPDVYKAIKHRENEAALKLLPGVLEEIDAVADERDRLLMLIQNAFAGNIFDLGCEGTVQMFEAGEIGFHHTRDKYTARPWLVDDFDPLAERMAAHRHRKAVIFVDNAGGDIVLGMTPIVRELLRRETSVVMSANSLPALNDVTHDELVALMAEVAAMDPIIRDGLDQGRLMIVASGNGIPGIDLRTVTPQLAEATADADLLIIQGMGRALETNYGARFTCDSLKMAMVKEQDVADLLGGKLYDVVCRFEPAQ